MDETLAEILVSLFSIIAVVALVAGLALMIGHAEESGDDTRWNNGHCVCGGEWKYEQAVGHRYDTTYIYVCDECNKRIELFEMR